MRSIRTPAIVLRRTNYGEADRIIQLITPDDGKQSVMARGVRREKSKLAGGIELFGKTDVTIGQGKGELGILTSARLDTFYSHILKDYEKLQFGYEVTKQISRAADQLDEPGFFELVDRTYAALNSDSLDVRVVKAWFWLQLAILLGVGLNLSTDDNGMKLIEDVNYDFDTSNEVFVFSERGRFNSSHIKFLRIISAQSPQVAVQVEGYEQLIDDVLWVAEQAVQR